MAGTGDVSPVIEGFSYLPELCKFSVNALVEAYKVDTHCRELGIDAEEYINANITTFNADQLECCEMKAEYSIPGEIILICAALKISDGKEYDCVERQTQRLYHENFLRMEEFTWAFSSGITQHLNVDLDDCTAFWKLVGPHICWKGIRLITPNSELLFHCPDDALKGFEEEFIYPFTSLRDGDDYNDVYVTILSQSYYNFKYPERVVYDTEYYQRSSIRKMKAGIFMKVWDLASEMELPYERRMELMTIFENEGINWIALKFMLHSSRHIMDKELFETTYSHKLV